MPKTTARQLALILLLSLVLRVVPVVANWQWPSLFQVATDSFQYQQIATNLLVGHGYTSSDGPPYEADVYRPPGYPVFLAAVYRFAGVSIPAAILIQIVVSEIAIALAYALVVSVTHNRPIALAAAFLLAIDPLSIVHANLLLTEAFSATIVLAGALLLVRYLRTGEPRFLLGIGALLGVGILVHPMLVFLPLPLVIVPLLHRDTRTWRQFGFGALAFIFGLGPTIGWMARNKAVADYPGISCVAAVNLMKYKAAGVLAEIHGTTREIERDRLTREAEAELPPGATQGDKFRLWQRNGLTILMVHPFVFAKIAARGLLLEAVGPDRDNLARFLYGSQVLGPDGNVSDALIAAASRNNANPACEVVRYLALAVQLTTFLLMAIGAWSLLRTRRFALLGIAAFAMAYVMALTGGPEAEPRFRVIYMPMLCMVAGAGLVSVANIIVVVGWHALSLRRACGTHHDRDGSSPPSLRSERATRPQTKVCGYSSRSIISPNR